MPDIRPGVFDLRAALGRAPTVQEYRDARDTFPEPSREAKIAALEARLSRLLEYGRRHGSSKSLRQEVSEIRAELRTLGVRT